MRVTRITLMLAGLALSAGVIGCTTGPSQSDRATTVGLSEIYVDDTLQVIDGFGGANLPQWIPNLTETQVRTAFGTGAGDIGLTILRLRVPYDSSGFSAEVPAAKEAESLGARVIASPWTPPPRMKSNDNIVGGTLKRSDYGAYAAHLKSFADYMARHGAPLAAISVQNEPDARVKYESCDWNAAELLTFMKDYAPKIGVPIIMPESENFNHSLSDPTLENPKAAAHVAIIGGHIYGGGLAAYPLAEQTGKKVWMTEHLDTNTSWAAVLGTGREINACMQANMNAYIWWYIRRFYGLLNDRGNVTKRGYVMSQFARFIRPGSHRIRTALMGPAELDLTAYQHGSKIIVVAINSGSSAVRETFALHGSAAHSFVPYVTSKRRNCMREADVPVAGGSFTATLEPSSITTFVSN